jgi:IS605 OrfB family transposase
VEDHYHLGMRGLAAHVGDLRAAVGVLAARCALRPGEVAPTDNVEADGCRPQRLRGYRSAGERFVKTRRLAGLRGRLAAAEHALAAGRPSIAVGGKRLWHNRTHLDATDMSEQQWRERWEAARLFLTADGESGKAGGNETIRVGADGRLRIKTPAALVGRFGSHLVIGEPIRFHHRGDEWNTRVSARRAVRYDIGFDPARGRWYLNASWKTSPEPAPELENLRRNRVCAVDLNDGHLAGCVLDASGNPIGAPLSIEVLTAGLSASHRDGRVRAAITALLDHAANHNCASIVMENLDFADTRATGRETLGRGTRGKRLRRAIAGLPARRFRDRLTSMAARRGIAVIGVDPAYTSKWGNQHWIKPLQQQTFDQKAVTGHHGAAAAIGRRGLGLAIRRRPAGPRNGLGAPPACGGRTVAGTPPARPNRHPRTTYGRCGSSGPPTHPNEVYRSAGKHPPAAANTVRAAQDSLLVTNQER